MDCQRTQNFGNAEARKLGNLELGDSESRKRKISEAQNLDRKLGISETKKLGNAETRNLRNTERQNLLNIQTQKFTETCNLNLRQIFMMGTTGLFLR